MKLTKSIIATISILVVSVSVLAQQPPPPPGGPGGPPPGGTAGTGGPADGPDGDHDEMPSKEEIIAAVGPACAQYVPDEPPSDPATFIAAVPDSCKSVFSQLMDD